MSAPESVDLGYFSTGITIKSMNSEKPIKLTMLDLVPISEGASVSDALWQAQRTAQHVEDLGFTRYWVAEHHNLQGVASSATAVLIGHIASGTRRIRVGSGGIMLPNHAPLTVAEAFGTLAELYPGRIDLGLGRAPGTDPTTMRALRRDRIETEDDFSRDVAELQALLAPTKPGQRVVDLPGAGTRVPIWLLGSSLFSATLAAERGLPFAFASHFAPRFLMQAISVYRSRFQPSESLQRPYVMIGVPVVAAPTDEQADYLASSVFQRILGILTGRRRPLQPPQHGFLASLSDDEQRGIAGFLGAAVIGSPDTVRGGLIQLQQATQADEMMLTCDIYDPKLRLRSLEIVSASVESVAA